MLQNIDVFRGKNIEFNKKGGIRKSHLLIR